MGEVPTILRWWWLFKNNQFKEAKADLGTKDHIHLLIDFAPNVSVSKFCNTLKTVTSREIRKRYKDELKPYYWKPVFWKRGYCAVSCGGHTLTVLTDILHQYITTQISKQSAVSVRLSAFEMKVVSIRLISLTADDRD